eukprot:scaffold3058_cov165-Ochromonas_danica.AAC.15
MTEEGNKDRLVGDGNNSWIDQVKREWNKGIEYIYPRSLAGTATYAIYGVTTKYIQGGATVVPISFYSYTLAGALSSVSFFGTASLLRSLRRKEEVDLECYAVSGGLHGAGLSAIYLGWKRSLIGAFFGAGFGAALLVGSQFFYQESRSKWLEYRRYLLYESVEKTVSTRRPTFSGQRMKIDVFRGKVTTEEVTSPPPPLERTSKSPEK